MTQPGAPQYAAPEAQIGRGQVKVRCTDGTEQLREVLIGGTTLDAWTMWANQKRFELENTRFVDIGGTVYRSETIDRIDPVRADGDAIADTGAGAALQVALSALMVIERGMVDDFAQAKALANQTRLALEDAGFSIPGSAEPRTDPL